MKWISVKDEMPDHDLNVLVVDNYGECHISYFKWGQWNEPYYGQTVEYGIQATHWMELPKQPKNGTKEKP